MTNYDGYFALSDRQDHNTLPPVPKRKPPGKKKLRSLVAMLALCVVVSGATAVGTVYWMNGNMESVPVQTESAVSAQIRFTGTDDTASYETGSISTVVEKVAASVVEITTETKRVNPLAMQYVTEGAGSGVILSDDGYIVTNCHVVEGATAITARLNGGTEYQAALVGTDSKTDLAVLKIEAEDLPSVSFADSENINVGDLAIAIGNPLGELGGTVTSGIISALDREITIDGQSMTLLQTSAAVNPGNSGGGLFNGEGKLVGVVNAKSSGSGIEGLAFAIPSDTVAEIAWEIIKNGYVTGRPQLGISVVEISDMQTAMMYRVRDTGVYVAEAGQDNSLKAGDRLISIDGVEIAKSSDISAILDKHSVGDTLSIKVARDGKEVDVKATLTEQAPENVQEEVQISPV